MNDTGWRKCLKSDMWHLLSDLPWGLDTLCGRAPLGARVYAGRRRTSDEVPATDKVCPECAAIESPHRGEP